MPRGLETAGTEDATAIAALRTAVAEDLTVKHGKGHWSYASTEKGVLAEFFPNSAADADKQRFVLKRLFTGGTSIDAPHYPRPDR